MTILDGSAEQDLVRLWALIAELSEQLTQNRSVAVALYGQVGGIKVRRVPREACARIVC